MSLGSLACGAAGHAAQWQSRAAGAALTRTDSSWINVGFRVAIMTAVVRSSSVSGSLAEAGPCTIVRQRAEQQTQFRLRRTNFAFLAASIIRSSLK